MITQDALKKRLNYDPETGLFRWKIGSRSAKVGEAAGSIVGPRTKHPRRHLTIGQDRILASRAAFIFVHGSIPPFATVDHADGDTLNDRIANLRLATMAQNARNRLQRDGAPMAAGVSKSERGRFKARIQTPDGKKVNLGTWGTEAEAHAAYMGAAAVLHAEFWVGARFADHAPERLRSIVESVSARRG